MPENPDIFLDSEIEFNSIDKRSSMKSNIFILGNNWNILTNFLISLLAYLRYLRELVDIENIISIVIQNIQLMKVNILIDRTLAINNINQQNINGTIYQVERVSDYIIKITNKSLDVDEVWDNSKLLIQVNKIVSETERMVVFPIITISTEDFGSILIQFNDKLNTNYELILL